MLTLFRVLAHVAAMTFVTPVLTTVAQSGNSRRYASGGNSRAASLGKAALQTLTNASLSVANPLFRTSATADTVMRVTLLEARMLTRH